MQEYRAAAAGDARRAVVIDFDNEIIEGVVAPESVAAATGIQPDRLVVMATQRVFTPGVFRQDGANRQKCTRPWVAVGAPPQPARPERAFWGPAIAFPLVGPDASAPQRDWYGLPAGHEPSPARIA